MRPLVILFGLFLNLSVSIHSAKAKPNFKAMTDVKEKKMQFFDYLHPVIHEQNKKIMDERKTLLSVKNHTGRMSPQVRQICEKYQSNCSELTVNGIEQLLEKVDIVPPSLALAQAANESGWGTSRFATEGNNYFGQWCFTAGCGMIPIRRAAGAKQEVKSFRSVKESVSSYMHNLNTGNAYKKLRELRAKFRRKGKQVSSETLAEGLMAYSERGKSYVDEIQQMIRFNELQIKYDIQYD
ncbi:MAG: glucosaminidase domain-containing protein [Cellvibrionales bacterium]|nr:glucosaminidase domain-containing protein [Cellvibrionales bacterium]